MNKEELRSICHVELLEASQLSSNYAKRIEGLQNLAKKVNDNFAINNFDMSILDRKGNQYIAYTYENNGGYSRGGVIYNPETISEDLIDIIIDAIDGSALLAIINEHLESMYDRSGTEVRTWYNLGCSQRCKIANWDYSSLHVRTSCNMTNKLLAKYRNSSKAFEIEISRILGSNDIYAANLIEAIDNFDGISINKHFEAKLDVDSLGNALYSGVVHRDEALSMLAKYKKSSKNGNYNIRVVDKLSQLGEFIVLYDLKYDTYNDKCSVSIVEERVIDLENKEIVTNLAIVSRIEQAIKLKEAEISLVSRI